MQNQPIERFQGISTPLQKHVLIEHINSPSSSEELEESVDAIGVHGTDSATCTERDNAAPRVYSLYGASENAVCYHHHFGNSKSHNIIVTSCERESSSNMNISPQNWELQLIQLSKLLAYSPVTLSSHEYISMSMIQIPEVLTSLNTYALTQGSLTWSFSKLKYGISFPINNVNPTFKGKRHVHKKILYILREDTGGATKFSFDALDKAKSHYIGIDKANMMQRQCLGHPEILSIHTSQGRYIQLTCCMEQAMHQLCCNLCQVVECQVEAGLGLTVAEHDTKYASSRKMNLRNYIAPLVNIQRPADRSNYCVAIQESHEHRATGSSKLELPREWNAFNALFKNTQLSSIQVLYLKSREVTIGATVREQQSCSSQNLRNNGSIDSEAVHQPMHTNDASPRSRTQASCSRSAPPRPRMRLAPGHTVTDARAHQSQTRGDEALVEGRYEIQIVDLTFSAGEITQLLHASHYDEIIRQLQNIPSDLPPESLIPTHFIIGVAYFKTSNYKKAREHFKKCANLAEEAHRDGDVMLCNAYLGDMEYASQSFLAATKYYKKAVKVYAPGSVALLFKLTSPTISAILAQLASAFRNVFMMVQAIHYYQTAISMATTDRDKLSAHISLGNLYQSMGDNLNALKEYEKSIKLATVLYDHVSLSWAHGNIGNAYLELNRKDEALYHLHKSLDLAIEYECTPQAIGRTYNNLGIAYQSMNDLDKAEEYYHLALSQATYGNDKAGQACVYGNIGNVHMLRKNYERAIPHYGEVLQLSNDPLTISTAQHNKGCAYYDWATSLQQSLDKECPLKIHGPECDIDVCLSNLSSKSKELYHKGAKDLEEVVKYHEDRLQHVKVSASGLTLSVSLFESNYRAFHCLQDCLYSLHMFDKALVVAEQSRARTLGELLLKRKGKNSIKPPLKFEQIADIIKDLASPLIYFSYTGARLICWLFLPNSGQPTMHTFDRSLTDDQFDGKSFDYHLCYSLTEKLVERSFEMYQCIEYDSESSEDVQQLYSLVGEPIQRFLCNHSITDSALTIISDNYTALLPLTCLKDPTSTSFLGDSYYFNSVPSLLTLGIMNKSAEVSINLECNSFCIVGDPDVPPFKHNEDIWFLGRLPYAKREAEWVAHALQTTPILNQHATKSTILSRLQRAEIVHIATHGSASAGFLAFAAFAVHTNDRKTHTVDSSNVLLLLEEVEKLQISPALVVLSSCDSGRGVVKADGIQGMARAFILAGAQSVLTTLWKVPDESASVFMQFFYQYLLNGFQSSLALQKAILSVRCFAKYSQYIHWSGYQLTGQDIHILNKPKPLFMKIQSRLGNPSVFPRLSDIKKLERLLKDVVQPTDVQILKGCYSVNPSEVVKDFILSSYTHFCGGIFWINCHPEMILSSVEYIERTVGTELNKMTDGRHQILFVLDGMTELPTNESLLRILKNHYVHIVAVYYNSFLPVDKLIRDVDRKLIRGCKIHNIEPLTMIHSTQRVVFSVMENCEFTPTSADQRYFKLLAELTLGSPMIIDTLVQLLIGCLDSKGNEGVKDLCQHCQLHSEGSVRCDLFDSVEKLLACCDLSCKEQLLLDSLSVFAGIPVPMSLIKKMSYLIIKSSQRHQLQTHPDLYEKLISHKLLLPYPFPVIVHPALQEGHDSNSNSRLMYIPQHVLHYLWGDCMDPTNRVFALAVAYTVCKAEKFYSAGLMEFADINYGLIGREWYEKIYLLYYYDSTMERSFSI